uniref:Uncharacterized protein n=1 Tax=Chenopodium quinoa TaxID=63459 RepID=A0A803MJU5_CHEQI
MHALIHDMAQWAVGDVGSKRDIKNISSRSRYFSCTKEVMEDQPWTPEKIGQLRTFAYFGSPFYVPTIQMSDSSFQRFHYLRLLSMADMGITELPNCIGDLKLLRYLDLSFNTELKEKLVTNMAHLTDLRHLENDKDSALMEMPLGIGRFCLTPMFGFTGYLWPPKCVDQNIEREVLDQLQPQKSIKELKSLVFPAWLGNPSFTQMVVIPSLKELWVKGMDGLKTVGPEFYGIGCSNPFPALKTSHFDHMESWSPPSVDNSKAFSHQLRGKFLTLVNCPTLSHYLYGDLDELTSVVVGNCKELAMFLEHSCPSSVRRLKIYNDNSLKQLSSKYRLESKLIIWFSEKDCYIRCLSNVSTDTSIVNNKANYMYFSQFQEAH